MKVSREEDDIRSIKKSIAMKKGNRTKNSPEAEKRLSLFKQNSTLFFFCLKNEKILYHFICKMRSCIMQAHAPSTMSA